MRQLLTVTIALAAALTVAGVTSAGTSGGYGGLGAKVSAFYAQNPHGPGQPGIGSVHYKVNGILHGRVVAYYVTTNFRPRPSNRDRITLLGGIDLPSDATETSLNSDKCLVWHSNTLKRLIGMAYAAATTISGTTTAQMRAEKRPRC